MQAVILAGGKSKSLAPITELRPKVLTPLLNKPLLQRVLETLPEIIDEVFITCNFRADDIESYLKKHKFPPRIEVVIEDRDLGSAGAIKNLEDKLEEDYLIISGDVVSSIDFNKLIEFHKQMEANITMSVFSVSNPFDYGIITMDPDGRITRFREKPKPDLIFSTLTNAGIYVANKKMMEFIPKLSYYDFAVDLLPYLLKKNFGIYGFQFYGYWMDLGRPERLLEAHKMLLQRTMEFDYGEDIKEARLLPPLIIGKQCKLKGTLGPEVCIGNRVTVKGAKITGSVIYDDVKVGANSLIKDSIICPGCQIGENCLIEGAVLADGCKISNKVKVSRNAKIWPSQKVKKDVGEDKLIGAPERR
jgi:mannose-1-phosphate guanylyltransferase/phosphomannomutase